MSAQSSIDTVRAGNFSFDTVGYRSDGDRALSPSPLSPPPPAPAVLTRAGGACDGIAPFRTSVQRGGVTGALDVPMRRLFAFRWGETRAEVRHGTVPGGGGGRVEREGWATIGEALDGDGARGNGRDGGDVGDGGDAYAHAFRLYAQHAADEALGRTCPHLSLEDYRLRPPVEVAFFDCDDCLYFDDWAVANQITRSIEEWCIQINYFRLKLVTKRLF